MLVFSNARLVFLAVPKTGSTAYEAALAKHASMKISEPPELKHSPVFRYNRFFRPMLEKFVGENLDVLAVMREPVSWLGSWYRYRQRPELRGHLNGTHDLTFDAFTKAYISENPPNFARVGSQVKFMTPTGNGTRVTHLFRYEDHVGLHDFLENRLKIKIATDRLNVSGGSTPNLSANVEAEFRKEKAEEFALWNSIRPNGKFSYF